MVVMMVMVVVMLTTATAHTLEDFLVLRPCCTPKYQHGGKKGRHQQHDNLTLT